VRIRDAVLVVELGYVKGCRWAGVAQGSMSSYVNCWRTFFGGVADAGDSSHRNVKHITEKLSSLKLLLSCRST
jgi:hypothetical protein